MEMIQLFYICFKEGGFHHSWEMCPETYSLTLRQNNSMAESDWKQIIGVT
jgi:hypothetical protein